MKRICVFCGSRSGEGSDYLDAAKNLGQVLAHSQLGLVYGGAKVGVMGAVADAVLAQGGEVIGVIPEALIKKEVAHEGLSELKVVDSMHTRKQLMADYSDGFIALPGGFGTLDEMFEVLTWSQLGIHQKPCGLLDVNGFFSALLNCVNHMVQQGFVATEHQRMLLHDTDAEQLLTKMSNFQWQAVKKWSERDFR